MKTNRVEKYRIKQSDKKFYDVIDKICFDSKNLYNSANYIIRQKFIETSKEKESGIREHAVYIGRYEMCGICKDIDQYKSMDASSAQQTLRILDQNWKSFFAAIKDWRKHPDNYLGRPKIPKYLPKDGRFIYVVNNQRFKIKDG